MEKSTGKAMVAYGPGIYHPYEMAEYPIPDVEADAILIKMTMACICGSDVHHFKGEYAYQAQADNQRPIIRGHEGTGVVYKIGSNMKTDFLGQPLKEGDRVVFPYYVPCGRCQACLDVHGIARCPYRHRFRGPSDEWPYFRGFFAEYYYVSPGQWIYKVPPELSDEMVAPINCAASTVAFGLYRARGSLIQDANVVVQGAGGLGLYAVAMAKEMGGATVISIDKLPDRLKLAAAMGADYTINADEYATPGSRVERVKELTRGRGADLTVEVNGNPKLVPEAIEMVMAGGTYLTMGLVTGGATTEAVIDMSKIVDKGITLIGAGNYKSWTIPKVMDFLVKTKDKYPFEKLASPKFKLEDINEAFRQAMAGDVIRATVIP